MTEPGSDAVAVIGLSGRFPGAATVEDLWRNLLSGTDAITRDYRGAFGMLDAPARFDASFFGYSPAEATLLDPQHRVLLECAWHALENAAYDPRSLQGRVGVYAGTGQTDYAEKLIAHRDSASLQHELGSDYAIRLGSAVDFATSRISHRLRLTGPAVTVQTACSTSLVAVHLAVQGLLAGDCDLALAGGATVRIDPVLSGQDEAGVIAPSGHCRPFDAQAEGTIPGNGAGFVVLRMLDDALAAGDPVHAVIRGSAIGNDGGDKIGFTAPSVQGQERTIRAAFGPSGLRPQDIGYVQAHGTATRLGDPIEVAALNRVYAGETPRDTPCVLGSVKSMIGHTDAAAGVAGLITAVLAVRDGVIPPTAHFTCPNPELDLTAVPFVVNTETVSWPIGHGLRRAAVNSLGLGGTNAHVIVEQHLAETRPLSAPEPQVLILSAATESAVRTATSQMAEYLRQDVEQPLADIAFTLQTGRSRLHHRRAAAALTAKQASAALSRQADVVLPPASSVVFVFPGQGCQYPGMGADLDRCQPAYAAALDECAAALSGHLPGVDLRKMISSPTLSSDLVASQINLFAVEWATASLWRSLGVEPSIVLGHSLGAVTAACVAGNLSLGDGMGYVVERARLFASLPTGTMLAVAADDEEIARTVPATTLRELSLAAVNAPRHQVLSGPAHHVAAAEAALVEAGVSVKTLRVAAPAHSRQIETVAEELSVAVSRLRPRPLTTRWISDRTGTDMSATEAADPNYWVAHARSTVRFTEAVATLLAAPGTLVLEVGPGHTASALIRQHPDYDGRTVRTSLPHPVDDRPSHLHFAETVAAVWSAGIEVDWNACHSSPRQRVALPGYPFEGKEFGPSAAAMSRPKKPAPTGSKEPRDDVEAVVAEAFSRVLGVDNLTHDDNFFELGGDSLIATRVVALLNAELGPNLGLTVRTVLTARTVGELAAQLRGMTRTSA
ncbi:acyltransferase domain-containing protein (plasmid) [Streptomyces chartreusis]|uniref:type I polyketide synthase n=1 Tax=Streptomyces chartreusis TaxID=1969 RepID=UPI002F90A532|nr:acyltransferase domain-containing protein [Streptomyces chartreusis]